MIALADILQRAEKRKGVALKIVKSMDSGDYTQRIFFLCQEK